MNTDYATLAFTSVALLAGLVSLCILIRNQFKSFESDARVGLAPLQPLMLGMGSARVDQAPLQLELGMRSTRVTRCAFMASYALLVSMAESAR